MRNPILPIIAALLATAVLATSSGAFAQEVTPLVNDGIDDQNITRIGDSVDLVLFMREDPHTDSITAFCGGNCQFVFKLEGGDLYFVGMNDIGEKPSEYVAGSEVGRIFVREPTPTKFFAELRGDLMRNPQFVFRGQVTYQFGS